MSNFMATEIKMNGAQRFRKICCDCLGFGSSFAAISSDGWHIKKGSGAAWVKPACSNQLSKSEHEMCRSTTHDPQIFSLIQTRQSCG